jgi:hypothetical protein
MLHPGVESWGCITMDIRNKILMQQYNLVHNLLSSEQGSNTLVVTP